MNKVIKNYFYNLSYQILLILVPLITTPYVSRVLGAKGVGTFSYTNSIVQYFIIFGCIGLNLYGQREIAYVQHQKQDRSKVFTELLVLRFFSISISLLLFFLTVVQSDKYGIVYLIMSLDVLASMFDISWFFQGIEDFKKIVIRNFVVKLLGIILIFLFVKNSDDLYLYVFCHSVTLLLGNLSMWLYVPKLVGKINFKGLNISRHIKPTLVLFLPQIATSVYTILDKSMIGFLTNSEEEVAYYEQSQKIVKIVLTLVTSLGAVMLPRVANLFKLNEFDKIKQYLSRSIQFTFFLSFPMCLGLVAVCNNIVPWFFGNGYDKVIPNMMIIAPILVFIAFSNIMGTQYLLPTGRQKEFTISVVSGTITNVCLNLLLIPKYASIGAAIATVIAEFVVTFVQIYYTRKDFDFKFIFKNNSKYIITSLIMFIPTFIISHDLDSSMFNTLISIIIGFSTYVLLLLSIKDTLLIELVGSIKMKLKRSK